MQKTLLLVDRSQSPSWRSWINGTVADLDLENEVDLYDTKYLFGWLFPAVFHGEARDIGEFQVYGKSKIIYEYHKNGSKQFIFGPHQRFRQNFESSIFCCKKSTGEKSTNLKNKLYTNISAPNYNYYFLLLISWHHIKHELVCIRRKWFV